MASHMWWILSTISQINIVLLVSDSMTTICPSCQSSTIVKQGFRYNKIGKKQKYQCRDCKSYFVEDDGFKGMHFKPEIITRAVHMHIDGLSLSKVQNHLYQHDGVSVSRWSICKWDKKLSDIIKKNSTQH